MTATATVAELDAAATTLGQHLGVTIGLVEVIGEGRSADRAAGRAAARKAFERAGASGLEVLGNAPDGCPQWPAGWAGSISHGAGVAVAAVSRNQQAVGIDVERAGALSVEEAEPVLAPAERERAMGAADPAALATLLWSAKEAAFKAWSGAAGGLRSLDPEDIRVDADVDAGTVSARLTRGPEAVELAGRFARVGGVLLTGVIGRDGGGAGRGRHGMTTDGGRTDLAVEPAQLTLDVEAAIFSTPSMRRLKPDPVPEEVIWATIDAATRGPSSGNDRRWGWVVVRDEAIKEVIGRWYLEAWNQLGPGRRERLRNLATRVLGRPASDSHHLADDPNHRSGAHLAQTIARAPVWIFAVLRRIPGQPSLVDGADIFGAVQNLMLAARKHGVGTTLTMLHRTREGDVAKILGLPADARAIALIPMGYPESGRFHTPRRPPVETVTHWDRWGSQRKRSET